MQGNAETGLIFAEDILLRSDQFNSSIFSFYVKTNSGRLGGLMVSALDSGSNSPGSSPGRVIVLCSWARQFYSHSASLHPGV